MVKNYLDIQKVRYEDLFEYKTEIEEGLGNYMVLKICLQAACGKCSLSWDKGIRSGQRNYMDPCFFRVRGFDHTKVEDDGAGMSQERIDQLNSWLKLKERGEE